MIHNALAAAGDDLEQRDLGFAVGDKDKRGGCVRNSVGPERGRGAEEEHVVSRDVGDHHTDADAPFCDAVDGFGVGRTGLVVCEMCLLCRNDSNSADM